MKIGRKKELFDVMLQAFERKIKIGYNDVKLTSKDVPRNVILQMDSYLQVGPGFNLFEDMDMSEKRDLNERLTIVLNAHHEYFNTHAKARVVFSQLRLLINQEIN